MKPANETVRGRIVDVDKSGMLTIKAYYPDWVTLVRRQYRDCNIQLVDSRPLSDKQRKACYALLNEISDYTGIGLEPTKIVMKRKFMVEELGEPDGNFSLSTASMSLTCAFQRYLIRFVLDFDVPCRFPLMRFVDDTQDYLYHCVVTRKCCICGKKASLHHWSRVGMGRDRDEINHVGMLAEPLCPIHHAECHTMAQRKFDEKYHIEAIKIDEVIARIWGLKFDGKEHDRSENRTADSKEQSAE